MKVMVTDSFKTIAFQAATQGLSYANSNYAPACCTGAITSDNGLDFLRRIARAN